MPIFNNREISVFIWTVLVLCFFLSKKDVRGSIPSLIKAAFHKKLVPFYWLAALHTTAGIYVLYKVGLWEFSELKDSIIWLLFSASLTLFKANQATKEKDFFKKAFKENIRYTVLVEFVVGLYTFSFITELFLIPVTMFIVLIQSVSKLNPDHAKVEKLFGFLLSVLGLSLVAYSIYEAVVHYKEFASLDTVRNLILSPFLAIWFLPYIYCVSLYMTYETYFIALGNAIKDPALLKYAKRQAVFRFNADTEGFARWKNRLFNGSVSTKEEIRKGISEIKRLQKVEKKPPQIDVSAGWSPYSAKDFLNAHGIKTRYYTNTYENEWSASSDYFKIGDDLMANNVTYYIEGTETVAKKLHLVLNVNLPDEEIEGVSTFLDFAAALYQKALNSDLPNPIRDAIIRTKNHKMQLEKVVLIVRREDWHHQDRYSVMFYIDHQ